MAQKWYQKASVQAAGVGGLFLVFAAIVATILGWVLPSTPQPAGIRAGVEGTEGAKNGGLQVKDAGGMLVLPPVAGPLLHDPATTEPGRPGAGGVSSTGPRAKPCVAVDVRMGDGALLEDVTLRCGPKGAGMVLSSKSTLRFTRDLEGIAGGAFPERLLSFDQLERLEFQDLDSTEKEAVRAYHAARSDFFAREWRKATAIFVGGTVWQDVYVYDKCSFESKLESGDLDALRPLSLTFRRVGGDCS